MFCTISGNKADLLIKTESIIKIEATPQKDGSDWQVRVVHEDSETRQFVIVHEDSEAACKELVAGIRETIIRETPPDHLSQRNETITNVRQESKKAAQQGDADAQYHLGVMYAKGEGVKKDEAEAVKWYTKAAQQGHALAQVNLGLMYHNKDEAEAVKWWTLAAQQGHANAQFFLGVMYAKGEGVKKDEAEAVKWYTKAAQQGDANAQYNLGDMYYNGYGVEKDYVTAHKWWDIAATQGGDTVRRARDTVAQQMTPDQIAEALRLAREWYA